MEKSRTVSVACRRLCAYACAISVLLCLCFGPSPKVQAQLSSLANMPRTPFTLRFPVSWEVLRSGFNTLDVALEAESYSEMWTLSSSNSKDVFLASPRTRVRVLGMYTQSAYGAPFDTLLITEDDLAKLLGIQYKSPERNGKWLFIELPIFETASQHFVLTASPEYFISVSLLLSFS